jgi:environmental stress-induced protein Ves
MQLLISPSNASVAELNFNWRLSIAKVGQAGPFSVFPGYGSLQTYSKLLLLLELKLSMS